MMVGAEFWSDLTTCVVVSDGFDLLFELVFGFFFGCPFWFLQKNCDLATTMSLFPFRIRRTDSFEMLMFFAIERAEIVPPEAATSSLTRSLYSSPILIGRPINQLRNVMNT